VLAAFARAGFPAPNVVESQAQPDPTFPTVSFPNPEEPGRSTPPWSSRSRPDRTSSSPTTRTPTAVRPRCRAPVAGGCCAGDEVGALLGAHLLAKGSAAGVLPDSAECVFANSIVSSRMLAAMCRAAGVAHEETLTGFKWISRVPGLRYGYEEALGYCVDPAQVRDKDGVSAALLFAELTAGLKAGGRSVDDLLDDLARAHGVHATDAFSVRVEDLSLIGEIMARLRATPLTSVAGVDVARADDLAQGDGGLPPTEGLRYYLADESRIIVRPSGTEPKLKVYLEVIEPVGTDEEVKTARGRAGSRLAGIRADLEAATRL
jgi:phosphomannomutase